jgi:hypothetical protein
VFSSHWRPWLGVEHRCVVPATSFSEYGQVRGPDGRLPLHWFATAPDARCSRSPGSGRRGPVCARRARAR